MPLVDGKGGGGCKRQNLAYQNVTVVAKNCIIWKGVLEGGY